MKDLNIEDACGSDTGLHGRKAALQVICLGASGGPCEENVTGFLVRSLESNWAKGSLLAVDAGSHLAPIIRILERDFPSVSVDRSRLGGSRSHAPRSNGVRTPGMNTNLARASLSPSSSIDGEEPFMPEPTVLSSGPFAGLKLPNASARANGLHVLRAYISTYLITHPHLDHLSGFAINTAAFHATSRPKTLAALPSTVDAVKQHIFNDVIWPNLTDEDGGVGFVTFQRLKEGGDAMVGAGEGQGYIDVVDGLGVRAFKVSHGLCTKSPPLHQHRGSISGLADLQASLVGDGIVPGLARSSSLTQQHNQFSAPGTPGIAPRQSFFASQHPSPRLSAVESHAHCVVDSTAYFIRDDETAREVLIFGDVEPDSISLSPRNVVVWHEAARKIAHHILGGIFIESSYDDSQADAVLFGHLNPRHLIAELQTLASLVTEAKAQRTLERGAKKRKRSGPNGVAVAVALAGIAGDDRKRSRSISGRSAARELRRSSTLEDTVYGNISITSLLAGEQSSPVDTPTNGTSSPGLAAPPPNGLVSGGAVAFSEDLPLSGIKVVIIHIKDTLADGPHVSENILAQLHEHEARLRDEGHGLGCEFIISKSGESYYF